MKTVKRGFTSVQMVRTHTYTYTRTHTHTHSLTQVHCQVPLASLWRPLVSTALPVAFAWQVWGNVHCQGLGCTPRCPSGVPLASLSRPSRVPWSPPLCRWLLCGKRGTMCTAKGSAQLYAPVFLWRGRRTMCTATGSAVRPVVPLASLSRPVVSATLPVAFAWQAWGNVHCQGLGVTRPLVSAALPVAFVWQARCSLASLWRPLVSAALPVASHPPHTHTHTLDKNGSLYDPAGTES